MDFITLKNSPNMMPMQRTNPVHLPGINQAEMPKEDGQESFGALVAGALDRVSGEEREADQLYERMLTHPDEVEPHDVSIAIAKSELSLNMAKSVIDRAVKAYNDIIGMR